jgi:hypothetical protein
VTWKSGSVPTNAIPTVDSPAQPEVYLIDKPDSVQSTICVATVAQPKHTAARFSLVLWSRFFNWREALMIVKPETLIGWHRSLSILYCSCHASWSSSSRKVVPDQ